MDLTDKITKKIFEGKSGKQEVTVVVKQLTLNESRQMYPYRPLSKYAESRFGGNALADDISLLLNKLAKKCEMCQAPTKTDYLSPYCPDCDGRSEYNGINPREILK